MPTVSTLSLVLTADSKRLRRELQRSTFQVRRYGQQVSRNLQSAFSGIALSAGAATAAIAAVSGAVLRSADELGKAARNAGISSDAYQRLAETARLAGINENTLTTALQNSSQVVLRAEYGLEQYTRNLERIGLRWQELRGLSPDEQFLAITDAIRGLNNESEKLAVASFLLGGAGRNLGTLLDTAGGAAAAAGDRLERLGGIIGNDVLSQAEALEDELSTLGTVVRANFTNSIVQGFAELTNGLSQTRIDEIIRSAGEAAANAGALFTQFAAAVRDNIQAIIGVAAALVGLNVALRLVALAQAVAALVNMALAMGRVAAIAATLALRLSPIGLAVTAVAATVGLIVANFRNLGGVVDTVAAGFRRAADILVGAFDLGFTNILLLLSQFRDAVVNVGRGLANAVTAGFRDAFNVVAGWIEALSARLAGLGVPEISIPRLQQPESAVPGPSETTTRLRAEVSELRGQVIPEIRQIVGEASEFVVNAPGQALEGLKSAGAALLEGGGEILSDGFSLVGQGFDNLGGLVVERIEEVMAGARESLDNAVVEAATPPTVQPFVGPPAPDNIVATETDTDSLARDFAGNLQTSLASALGRGDFSSIGDVLLNSITQTLASAFSSQLVSSIFGGFLGGVFHDGGIVPGRSGQDVPIIAQAGEYVLQPEQVAAIAGSGGGRTVNVSLSAVGDVTDATRRAVLGMGEEVAAIVNSANYEARYA